MAKSEDKQHAEFDAYMKDGLSTRERVGIALDQAMSDTHQGLEGRETFAGIGPGVSLGGGTLRDLTVAEFRALMKKRREELRHGVQRGKQPCGPTEPDRD